MLWFGKFGKLSLFKRRCVHRWDVLNVVHEHSDLCGTRIIYVMQCRHCGKLKKGLVV